MDSRVQLPTLKGFPDSSAGIESAYNTGDPGLIPGSGRSAGRRDRLHTAVFLGFPGSSDKEFSFNAGDLGSIPGLGRPLGEGNGYPLSILDWRILWTEGPGGLQSMGSQRGRHD